MEDIQNRIHGFFNAYESHFNEALKGNTENYTDALTSSFESCFAASGPQGVQCGQNDQSFILAMLQGIDFYKSIGSISMQIMNNEITLLDPLHAISKISWRYAYAKNEKDGFIDFDVFYFLRITTESVKIFAYITGDEQAALRQHGLI